MPRLLTAGHEIVAGTIGMGKSYWVLYKIVQSLIHNRPCCYIDPKGDTYLALLNFLSSTTQGEDLWDALGDRILFLNPVAKCDHLLGFNALDPLPEFAESQPDPVALLANALVSHIRGQSGFELADANRMQNIMAAAVGLLVEGGRGELTLAELPLLFAQSHRREGSKDAADTLNPLARSLLEKVTHHGTRTFWKDQWPTWTSNARREWVQSTEGRIFQYLFDERLLMTVCSAAHSKLDFRKIVGEGHWLFVNIPYALLSDTVTTLLGNLIATRLFYACMQRRPGSQPYRLILDEARFFNSGPLDVILETSRAYNLWLTLVVQSLNQMCRTISGRVDEHLLETALNNARYFSIFHNTADNEALARLMFPITGRAIAGFDWLSWAVDYLPVPAEVNEHERRFMNLGPREMVIWDKLGGTPPEVWRTPAVVMDTPDYDDLAAFEADHLKETGTTILSIHQEIQQRQERIRDLFEEESQRNAGRTSRAAGRMKPGGEL